MRKILLAVLTVISINASAQKAIPQKVSTITYKIPEKGDIIKVDLINHTKYEAQLEVMAEYINNEEKTYFVETVKNTALGFSWCRPENGVTEEWHINNNVERPKKIKFTYQWSVWPGKVNHG